MQGCQIFIGGRGISLNALLCILLHKCNAVVGCGNRFDREKGTRFFCLPSVIAHQGEKTHNLSKKWHYYVARKGTQGGPWTLAFVLCLS